MKNVVFILPNLSQGGAQKVFLEILPKLSPKNKYHLFVLNEARKDFEVLPQYYEIHELHSSRTIFSFFRLVKKLRELEPDTVFSTLYHVNILCSIASFFLKKKPVLNFQEANTPSVQLIGLKKLPARILLSLFYPKAHKILCLSEHMKKDLHANFGLDNQKLVVIYNPASNKGLKETVTENPFSKFGNGPHILAVGRLNYQKDYPYLIEKFYSFKRELSSAHLWILGTGELESDLKDLIKKMKLEDSVHLEGFQKETNKYYQHTDLFVMSSIFEGTPNVLMEALQTHCPILIRKHHGGTEEVMNILGISDRYVDDLIFENSFFQPLPEDAFEKLRAEFSLEKIASQYESLI